MVLVNFYPKSRLNCIKTMSLYSLSFCSSTFLLRGPPNLKLPGFSTINFRFQEYFFYSKRSPDFFGEEYSGEESSRDHYYGPRFEICSIIEVPVVLIGHLMPCLKDLCARPSSQFDQSSKLPM
jgi:hypothetical protein